MKTRLLPILLSLSIPFAGLAHDPVSDAYNVKHFTDENGLPQNSVKFIAPDKEGFLWLATENGLVKFDGSGFRSFNNSRIRYIYPAAGRRGLFARTEDKQVIRISGGQAEVMPDAPQRSGGADYEYLVCNDISGIFPVTGLPNLYAEILEVNKYIMPVAANAYFNIGRDSVIYLENDRQQYGFSWHNCNPWNFFTIKGRLYNLLDDGRFLVFRRNIPQEVKITGDVPEQPLTGRHLYWNYVAEQLFIYQDDKCYYITEGPEGTLHAELVLEGADCEKNDVISVYYDPEQERVFLGSRSRGLYIYTKKQFHPLVSPGDADNVFYAQAPFGNDGIVTAQGIAFDRDGKARGLPLLQNIRKANRYSLLRDKQGNYWYKHGNTVYKYNSDITKILWQRSFGGDLITQLYLGAEDKLWVGTEKAGLYYLNANAPSPVPLLFSNKITDATYMMHETPNLLWVNTLKGLFRLQLSPVRIDTLPEFKDRYLRSLFIPMRDEVWITTYDKGIFLYRQGKLTSMPEDRLGYLKTAHCITADDRGFYWITTNKGLFQAARKDLLAYADEKQRYVYYFYYGRHQGLLTNEFNGGCQPCALKLGNGDLSLPSLDGLLRFTPDNIHPELPDGPLLLSQADLDTKPIAVGDTIHLPNSFLRLALHVSTPYFGDPYNLQLVYSIEGGEDEASWLPVETSGVIAFSRLHSGTYKLHIRKVNGFGINNYTEKVVTLIVQAAWFETLPFRILAFCCAVLLVFAYTRIRMAHMHRKNRVLKHHVSERTRELEETLESLQTSEQQLRKQGIMQQRLITAITHDIKTPMKYLMLLSQTAHSPEKKSAAMNDALYRMYNMVENLIQYMKMEVIRNHSYSEHVDLHELLEEKAGIFRPIAEIRSVQIHNNAGRGIQVPVNRQLLAIVVNNLLDNAVKYTVSGSVSLAASYEEGGAVSIRVTDTGIGIQPEIREWINGERKMITDERQPFAHKGIGLVIVIELLEQINGKLFVHSNDELGTSMEVLLHVN